MVSDPDIDEIIIKPGSNIRISNALWVSNNKRIIATGATITMTHPGKAIYENACYDGVYNSIKNVELIGGTYKNAANNTKTPVMRFAHGTNMLFKNVNVETNFGSHGIELIAMKNVVIDNCKVVATNKSTASKTSLEEAVQIDISTPKTAPSVAKYGSKYVQGQTCENITVKNSTISGSRGLCANKTTSKLNNFHKKITVTNNTITGTSSEALALHNAVGLTVKNNKIYTINKRYNTVYSIGLNIATFGKNSSSTKYKNVISGNTVKGGRQGLWIYSYGGSKYGPTTVTNNKLYSKVSKSNAKAIRGCTKVVDKGNKTYKW